MSEINIPPDMECCEEYTVKHENTAKVIGSGDVGVLSTPSMIAFMEYTAWKCVQKYLPPNLTTVGTHVDVYHVKPAPVGCKVKVKVKLLKVEGRKLTFEVKAYWNDIEIGKGIHERFIVDKEKFLSKVKKLMESAH